MTPCPGVILIADGIRLALKAAYRIKPVFRFVFRPQMRGVNMVLGLAVNLPG